jgi:copper oxidase (laccase) domain-containing protein
LIDQCTFTSPELFSHRRDGIPTGRQGGFIGIRTSGNATRRVMSEN